MSDIGKAFGEMIALGLKIQSERWQELEQAKAREKWGNRLRDMFGHMNREEVRALWDRYDGCNTPDGFEGEDIHGYLNLIGDGRYCAV